MPKDVDSHHLGDDLAVVISFVCPYLAKPIPSMFDSCVCTDLRSVFVSAFIGQKGRLEEESKGPIGRPIRRINQKC
jgi:hypothetical protein